MKVSVIGSGSMADIVMDYFSKNKFGIEFGYIYGRHKDKAEYLCNKYKCGVPTDNLNMVIGDEDTEIYVECASQELAKKILPEIIEKKKKVIIMSVGIFNDDSFSKNITHMLQGGSGKLFLTHGAIGGLDAVKSASLGDIYYASLETRKNPASLGIEGEEKEKVLFEGPARIAVSLYPANVNVAAILSIYSLGFDKTMVRIVSDPAVHSNIHTINITGSTGSMKFIFENKPSTLNKKTSALAAYSLISKLIELSVL